jgi:site-specific recombinase XerD
VKQNDKGIGLQDLVEGFLFSLQAEGRALRTHKYYAKLLCHLVNFSNKQCWPLYADQIEPKHLRQFLSWVSSRSYEYNPGNGSGRFVKSKPSTAWPYYKALRRLFNWSVEESLILENPAKDLHFKAPPLPPIQPYHPNELKNFLAVCEHDIKTGARFTGLRNKAMILLFIDSGLRLSELALLTLQDIDLDQKVGSRNRQRKQSWHMSVFAQDGQSYLALFTGTETKGEM